MASTAIVARGTTLGVGDAASPEVFTTIANIPNVSGPGSSADDIEVTDLSSTAKEFLLDLTDNGSVSMTLYYAPGNTQHVQLQADNAAGTARNYQIAYSSSPNVTYTFNARVSEWNPEAAVGGALSASVSLRVNGAVTVA